MKIPLLKKKFIFGDTVKMKLGISGTIQKNVTQPLLTLLISLDPSGNLRTNDHNKITKLITSIFKIMHQLTQVE